MKKLFAILLMAAAVTLQSCSQNYSNGERIGLVTQFSKTGAFWKSWEGHLNMTQTGMNSSQAFDFSVDNDDEDSLIINTLDSAARLGWKVKLNYHQTLGYNWFSNRGHTNYFVTGVQVLDRNPVGSIFGDRRSDTSQTDVSRQGRVIDTIYVVIDKTH